MCGSRARTPGSGPVHVDHVRLPMQCCARAPACLRVCACVGECWQSKGCTLRPVVQWPCQAATAQPRHCHTEPVGPGCCMRAQAGCNPAVLCRSFIPLPPPAQPSPARQCLMERRVPVPDQEGRRADVPPASMGGAGRAQLRRHCVPRRAHGGHDGPLLLLTCLLRGHRIMKAHPGPGDVGRGLGLGCVRTDL